MTAQRFYLWLTGVAVISLIISILTANGTSAEALNKASYLLIGFFVFFTVAMFVLAGQALKSANPYLFTRVFMVSISLKIALLAMLVVSFVKFMGIRPKELVGPLLSSYLLFTIFETWVLIKLSKSR